MQLFRDDAYRKSCEAEVVAAGTGGVELSQTVFYPMGGGQPGDTGVLRLADGKDVVIIDTRQDKETGRHIHIPADGADLPPIGTRVEAVIDWDRRYRHMRMHSALHLLCAVVDGGVTGGQIGEEKSRLDFDLPDTRLDKEAIDAALNRLVEEDHAAAARWISDAEMDANEDLVRTMSVKPPRGGGKVRLLEINGVDLQPCGGTHVARTSEIGRVRVGKIENKGKRNRRVNIHLVD